jgi:hypothetical protein
MDRTLYFEAFFMHESNKNLDAIHSFDRAEAKPAQVQGKNHLSPQTCHFGKDSLMSSKSLYDVDRGAFFTEVFKENLSHERMTCTLAENQFGAKGS